MSFLTKLLEWSDTRPDWQSDLFRRTLQNDEDLTTSPHWEAVRGMVLNAIGLPIANKPVLSPIRAKAGTPPGEKAEVNKLTLKSIKCLSNINAIPDGSELPFGHAGLTIVYGENGSGKSSYSRVLKSACRARDTEEVLHNVYLPKDSRLVQAEFKFCIGSENDQFETWSADTGGNTVLTSISVFDAKCGRVTIENDIQLRYKPYGADSFSNVAKAQRTIQEELSAAKPKPSKPEILFKNNASSAAVYFQSINADTPESQIWIRLPETNELLEKLEALRELNRKANEGNVESKITEAKLNLANVQKAIDHVRELLKNLSEDNIGVYNKTLHATVMAHEEQSAHGTLGKEPLSHAGGDVWKRLYFAAREYSQKVYENRAFPNTDENSLCVWCMQELDSDSKLRMQRFEKFMDDGLAKKVVETERLFELSKLELFKIKAWEQNHFDTALTSLQTSSPTIAEAINTVFISITKRNADVLLNCENRKVIVDWTAISLPEAEFAAWVTERLEEIEKQEAASKPEAREVLKKELVLLEDEFLLLQNREGVLNYLRQSKISKIYDKAIRELDFRGLSTKLGELIKETSTPELQSIFGSELDTMGGGHLKITFGTAGTSGGQTKHKIQFHPGAAERAKIAAILSEGEQRVIALAGFMAELTLEGNQNPIVFDDPVTSLDHLFREKIASRLAKESVARQVIVFTHDIAFLMRLEYWAKVAKASCRPLTVERTGQIIGNWKEGKPWHAMKAPEKIALISKEFTAIEALPIGSEYNEKVMNLYGKLREAWESIVEDVLFHSVVRRHQKEVLISQLRYICFDDTDHEEFQQSYTKCSDFFAGHSHSEALDANMPVPSEVKADIKKAEDFISRIEANQKAKEKQRKQPVTSQIG